MSTIDQRIVDMQFNNAQFEKGIATSIKSLADLNKGLNIDDSHFSKLDASITTIADRFTTLGIAGVTAIQNIANRIIDLSVNMVKSLSIDPIMDGYREYEMKMDSITTILTNTKQAGTTLDDVNKALDELNSYADMTVYNFGQMTTNIGKFTASGVGLEDSVAAIKGIANVAAGAGSNTQQMSSAMYNLSQSISSGRLMLQDWNSVVNAGMGGPLLQNALIDAAYNLGQIDDALVSMFRNGEVSFRSLIDQSQHGVEFSRQAMLDAFAWASTDETLTLAATQVKTFTQLIDTMGESVGSGWASTWEHIIGNREQAIEVFTAINNTFDNLIGTATEARNATLDFWNANGGRDAVIQGLANTFKVLGKALAPIGKAFQEIFPATTGPRLVALSEGLRALTERFKIGDKTVQNVHRTFKGLFSVLEIIRSAFVVVAKAIGGVISVLMPLVGSFFSITAVIGDFFVKLKDVSTNVFEHIVRTIGSTLTPISEGFNGLASLITDTFGLFKKVDTTGLDSIGTEGAKQFGILATAGQALKTVFEKVGESVRYLADLLKNTLVGAFEDVNFDTILGIITTGMLIGVLGGIKSFVKGLTDVTDDVRGFFENFTGIFGDVRETLDAVRGSLEAYQANLQASTLLKIATAVGILAASIKLISTIDEKKIAQSMQVITMMFLELFAFMAGLSLITAKGFFATMQISTMMITLATSLFILAAALKQISDLDMDGLLNGLVAMGGLAAILVISSNALGAASLKIVVTAGAMVTFAIALNLMANALKQVSKIDSEDLGKGLMAIASIMGGFVIFMKLLPNDKQVMSASASLILLGVALNIMAVAVKQFGTMDTNTIVKGLSALGGVLLEFILFMKLMPNDKKMMATATGLLMLSGAMLIIANALSSMGNMSWEEIAKGLTAMGGALGILTIALTKMSGTLGGSVALSIAAAALSLLIPPLILLGGMSVESVLIALGALGGALGVIGLAAVKLTPAIPALLGFSAAIVLMGVGLLAAGTGIAAFAVGIGTLLTVTVTSIYAIVNLITSVINRIPDFLAAFREEFSQFKKEVTPASLTKGLIALAGGLAILGLAMKLLQPIIPTFLAFSAGVLLLGSGIAIGAVGIKLLAEALESLAVTGGHAVNAMGTIIEGVVEFVKGIAAKAPEVMDAVGTMLMGFIDKLVEMSPDIMASMLTMLMTLLNTIKTFLPKILETGVEIILQILTGIESNLGLIVEKAIDVVVAFIGGIAKKLPDLIDAGFKMIIDFINGLADAIEENAPLLIESFFNLAGAMIKGLVKGLIGGIGDAVSAIKNVGSSIIDGFKDVLGIASPSKEMKKSGQFVVDGLIEGLKSNSPGEAAAALAEDVRNGLGSSNFKGIGDTAATDFLRGLSDKEIEALAVGEMVALASEQGIEYNIKDFKAAGDRAGQAYIDGLNSTASQQTDLVVYGLVEGLQSPDPAKAAMMLSTAISEGLLLTDYVGVGDTIGTAFLKGLSDKEIEAKAVAEMVANATKAGIEFNIKDFEAVGKQAGQAYIDGLNAKIYEAEQMANRIASTASGGGYTTAFRKEIESGTRTNIWTAGDTSQASAAKSAGAEAGKGLANGLKGSTNTVKNAAASLAKTATTTVKSVLGIKSPSKVFGELGMFSGLGFVLGLESMSNAIKTASNDAGEKALTSMKSAINKISTSVNDDIDSQPVIRPVLDLSDVQNGIGTLTGMFSHTEQLTSKISANMHRDEAAPEIVPTSATSQPTSIVFQQTNVSPKALSRTEIYRTTNNLISKMKGRGIPT